MEQRCDIALMCFSFKRCSIECQSSRLMRTHLPNDTGGAMGGVDVVHGIGERERDEK